MTTATTLRTYQDIIEGKLPPGLQAHIDAKSESKEEEVEESKEEEVEESTHFSLSQVNNAPILRKYQDILKEVTQADLDLADAEGEKYDRQARSNAEFDAAYDEMFGDEFDDPNSGMLDTFWRNEDEVRRAKRKRYADALRLQGMDAAGDAEEAKKRTKIRQNELDRIDIIAQGFGDGRGGAMVAPTAAQIAANPGYKHSSAVAVLPTIGGPGDDTDNSAYNDDEPESALASTDLVQPAKAPVAQASSTSSSAYNRDTQKKAPVAQASSTSSSAYNRDTQKKAPQSTSQASPDPSGYVDSWRRNPKKKTTPRPGSRGDR